MSSDPSAPTASEDVAPTATHIVSSKRSSGGGATGVLGPSLPASVIVSGSGDGVALLGSDPIRHSTLMWVWRFIVALKQRVANLVRTMQQKNAEVRRLLLERFPVLAAVPPALMQQLCLRAQKKFFQRKYILLQQGVVSEYVYLVQQGSLAVFHQSEHVLASTSVGLAGLAAPVAATPSHSSSSGGSGAGTGTGGTASRNFESMHLADVLPGDEAGMYGLFRPPTIVNMATEKQTKAKASRKSGGGGGGGGRHAEGSGSDSEDEGKKGKSKRGSLGGGGGSSKSSSARVGYPQPHSVIVTQSCIVFAISARMFREALLHSPPPPPGQAQGQGQGQGEAQSVYAELRDQLTDRYLLRLRRFELWEIGRMRAQKIRLLQSSSLGGAAGSKDPALLRRAYEQAEAAVARESIASLYQGSVSGSTMRRMITVDALRQVGKEGEEEVPFEQLQNGGEGIMLSQFNEAQSGELDARRSALSAASPHHPPASHSYLSVSALVGQSRSNPPPAVFLDTRKLVGSRREYELHSGVGQPSKHQIVATGGGMSASALALVGRSDAQQEAQARQLQVMQQHTLPPLSMLPPSHSAAHPSSLLEPADADPHAATYMSPAEQAYQKRLRKLAEREERKEDHRRTREEEKFLEEMQRVSRNVGGNAAAAAAAAAKRRSMQSARSDTPSPPPPAASRSNAPRKLAVQFADEEDDSAEGIIEATPVTVHSASPGWSDARPVSRGGARAQPLGGVLSPLHAASSSSSSAAAAATPGDGTSTRSPRSLPQHHTSTNPLYEHLPTLPAPALKGLFQSLRDHNHAGSQAVQNPALYLLETLAANKQLHALPTLPREKDERDVPAGGEATRVLNPGDHWAPMTPAQRAASRRGTAILDLSPTPKPNRKPAFNFGSSGAAAAPVLTTLPPAFHSVSEHAFTDEVLRGLVRASTPPLVPPPSEDERVLSIRRGIQRAQQRVKASVTGGMQAEKIAVVVRASEREARAEAASNGLSLVRVESKKDALLGVASPLSPTRGLLSTGSAEGPLSPAAAAAAAAAATVSPSPSPSTSSLLPDPPRRPATAAAPDLYSPSVPASTSYTAKLMAKQGPAHERRRYEERQRKIQKARQASQEVEHGLIPAHTRSVHEDVTDEDAQEERDEVDGDAPRPAVDRNPDADELDAGTMRAEARERRKQRIREENSETTAGVGGEEQDDAGFDEAESKQQPRVRVDASRTASGGSFLLPTPKLGQSRSLPSFADSDSPPTHSKSPHKRASLVPASSLSTLLEQSKLTPSALGSALPSVATAFGSNDPSNRRGLPDRVDQVLIEALTSPAHTVLFDTPVTMQPAPGMGQSSLPPDRRASANVATALASMLSPFRADSDPLAGRGIVIPSYQEDAKAREELDEAFRRSRRERKKIRGSVGGAGMGSMDAGVAATNMFGIPMGPDEQLIPGGVTGIPLGPAASRYQPQHRTSPSLSLHGRSPSMGALPSPTLTHPARKGPSSPSPVSLPAAPAPASSSPPVSIPRPSQTRSSAASLHLPSAVDVRGGSPSSSAASSARRSMTHERSASRNSLGGSSAGTHSRSASMLPSLTPPAMPAASTAT